MNNLVKIILVVFSLFILNNHNNQVNAKRNINCGIKCYRYRKCMGQLDGKGARPGQLGNTGQIVLNQCDQGECDCAAEAAKKTSTTTTTTTTTTTERYSNSYGGTSSYRRRPSLGRFRSRGLSTSSNKKKVTKSPAKISKPKFVKPKPAKYTSRYSPGVAVPVNIVKEESKQEDEPVHFKSSVSVSYSSSTSDKNDQIVEEKKQSSNPITQFNRRELLNRSRLRRFYHKRF